MLNTTSPKQNNIIEADKPMFPISIVAQILQVHQRTLRIYDEIDLLKPQRTAKNRRLYSCNDIERGKFIQYLTRELGINLVGVKIIINLLAKQKINSSKCIDFIKEIAEESQISLEIQEQNREKFPKRGRKPSVKVEEAVVE